MSCLVEVIVKTLPMQLSAMRDYAKRRHWAITAEVQDVGSGDTTRETLIAAARQREIDLVLVWRLDRWGRSLLDLVHTLQKLNALDVGFVSLCPFPLLEIERARSWPQGSRAESTASTRRSTVPAYRVVFTSPSHKEAWPLFFCGFGFSGFSFLFIHRSSRSYYLFFNYLSYYLYMCPLSAKARGGMCPLSAKAGRGNMPTFSVENSQESHKSVDIGGLRVLMILQRGAYQKLQPGSERPMTGR